MKIMKYTIISLILIASTLLLLSSCETTPPPDPGPSLPTHDPGRIVTCKIDGEEWSHGVGWCPMCHSLVMNYYSEDKNLYIRARNFLNEPFDNALDIYIYIYIYIDSVGDFSYINHLALILDSNKPVDCNSIDYYPDSIYNNQFHVEEFDPIKKKIRGTFEFRAISYKCQDTIFVTDGYFDLNPTWH